MIDGSDQIYRSGDGTALRFYYEPSKNNFLSEKAGRAVFDSSLMVEVITPGSTESLPKFEIERTLAAEAGTDAGGKRIVKQGTKYAQYVQQVEAFKAQNGEHLESGTPISQWAQIDVGTAASLKAAGIHTVEMLGSVSDGNLQNLGTGGRVLRDQAIAFLQARQFGVPTAQMAADTAHLREDNIRLQNQVRELGDRLNAALADVQALRSGTPPPQLQSVNDPLSFGGTITQPNPGASLEPGSANTLTPEDAGAADDVFQQQGTLGTFQQPPEPLLHPLQHPPGGAPPII